MGPFRITPQLWERIHHYAAFPPTGVSLQQMIRFGQNSTPGTLLKGSQFLSEELPIRLAHRVKELDQLPMNLGSMPSINVVKNWYAQSFEELITFPPPPVPLELAQALSESTTFRLPEASPNPCMRQLLPKSSLSSSKSSSPSSSFSAILPSGTNRIHVPMERRYYSVPNIPLASFPPQLHEYNQRFTKTLENIKRRHDPTVTTVAQGVLEWKNSRNKGAPFETPREIQEWLDRFYMSRIGIRFLIGQHVALNTLQPHPDYVGIICTRSNVHDIVSEAIENARFVCEEHYAMFKGPPVHLICPKELTIPYVPGHLSHIIFELLKNSLRAVVERFGTQDESRLPAIKVVVVEGKEDITIKISDEGGGIPRSAIPLIWTYMYTTMDLGEHGVEENLRDSDFKAPMAGFGYGLPLSRLYARYFGGDLKLISMEGYGTDVYIHLNRLSSSAEPLPY
ncbi:hypothetical protein M407DRAFT_243854 [Tulasnella calospora MUT 4182]|uniref:Protein-serine/threonine kinase n=1 Tax=Tulasnella calospora MUT 4182 TaxID=1051891 RepID=A0A0C3QJ01_9AGAM|nr:hypothetical protein M407DRAFT_243854 [Tulasnella calospora MUT 4182]